MSGDGLTVVGYCHLAGESSRAFLWHPTTGMVDLNSFLPTLGIDLTGWTLRFADAVSTDGSTLAGSGAHDGLEEGWVVSLPRWFPCYANCDHSHTAPVLNVSDFICFQTKFAAADPAANCDGSTTAPILTINDFVCFLNSYAQGCP